MIRLEHIAKKFYTENGKKFRYILKDVNLTLPNKGLVSILGPSGCGKTTFLNIISTLETPDEGKLYFNDIDSSKLNDAGRDELRHLHIGYIYQEHNLISHQTVYENIRMSFNLGSTLSRKEEDEKIKELSHRFQLDDLLYNYPNSLSGGEKERVAIARAIANNPDVLLADEPTGSLDEANAIKIMDLLKQLAESKLVILVSHNQELVDKYSDRILRMKEGVIISDSQHEDKAGDDKSFVHRESKRRPESIFRLALARIKNKLGRYSFVTLINALGVAGVCLTLAAYRGANDFATEMQKEALLTYPLMVSNVSSGIGNSFLAEGGSVEYPDDGKIHRVENDNSTVSINPITPEFVEYLRQELPNADIATKNGLAPQILVENSTKDGINTFAAKDIDDFTGFESIFNGSNNYFRTLSAKKDIVLSSYDVVAGTYPEKDDEAILLLDGRNAFPSYALDLFGLPGDEIDFNVVLNKTFKFISNDDFYIDLGYNEVEARFLKDVTTLKEEGKQPDKLELHLLSAMKAHEEKDNAKVDEQMDAVDSYFNSTKETKKLHYYGQKSSYSLYNDFKNPEVGKEIKISCILRPKKGLTFPFLLPAVYYSQNYSNLFQEINRESSLAQDYHNHITFQRSSYSGTLSIPNIYKNINSADKLEGGTEQQITNVYSYFLNRKMYGLDDSLFEVRILCRSFEDKDYAKQVLDKWNATHPDDEDMHYSDIGGMLNNTIKKYVGILIAVLYVVIAVVILSNVLVTSLTAILEINSRSREIGIYRSLGGKSSYVRLLFISEEGIVGLGAGILGVGVTYAALPLVNLFMRKAIDATIISNFATLPAIAAIIIALSALIISLLSTFVPSILATKTKPSKALRNM